MAATPSAAGGGIVPAQLGFLAIYNPSLGATDATVDEQIVYYASVSSQTGQPRRRHRRHHQPHQQYQQQQQQHYRNAASGGSVSQEERNERLRQIGLVQGMVEFGRNFSGGSPVDSIDTEKSRVVLRELEPGWWILASIDLTRLPLPTGSGSNPGQASSQSQKPGGQQQQQFEYSSREVKPAALLQQDLLRAHSVFLLHHASSLSALFLRTTTTTTSGREGENGRARFAALLGRYWDGFLATWDVMLHGNPARAVFGGIRMAACGELGFGVGEEDRGSAERAVLEGLVGRVEGLVDLVVGTFGDAGDDDAENAAAKPEKIEDKKEKRKSAKAKREEEQQQQQQQRGSDDPQSWLGTGKEPGAEDGAVFLGTGALSRHSLRDVFYWMEDLYTWGEHAYGVAESPVAMRQKPKRRKVAVASKGKDKAKNKDKGKDKDKDADTALQVPPSILQLQKGAESTKPAGTGTSAQPTSDASKSSGSTPQAGETEGAVSMDKLFNYLKLGYGTAWTLGGSSSPTESGAHAPSRTDGDTSETEAARPSNARKLPTDDGAGHFLIGLKGEVEETERGSGQEGGNTETEATGDDAEMNSRTLLRTLTVELESEGKRRPETQVAKDYGSHDTELLSEGKPDDDAAAAAAAFDSQDRNKTKKLRVVVYVNRPFIFTFLFELRTDSLAWDALYRSLHYQLAPLRKPLLASTAFRPDRAAIRPGGANTGGGADTSATARIFDLIWDPHTLTVHSTIPNIPDPPTPITTTTTTTTAVGSPWTRAEALSTHTQLLNTYAATRADLSELERTVKTSRGWWVVWHRLLARDDSNHGGDDASGGGDEGGDEQGTRDNEQKQEEQKAGDNDDEEDGEGAPSPTTTTAVPSARKFIVSKEIFLVRKAGDHLLGAHSRGASASFGLGGGGSGGAGTGGGLGARDTGIGGWADGASRLAQGIGIDTRRYIEGLLSLNP